MSAPLPLRRVVAIGNFDGVHRGHQALVDHAVAVARALDATATALTFWPHPRRFLRPDHPPLLLTEPALRETLLRQRGIAEVVTLPFDAALAALPAERFVRDILIARLDTVHVVVGEDYRFGAGRAGDAALLRQLGHELGFGVTAHRAVCDQAGRVCSSSRVRAALAGGDLDLAREILGCNSVIIGDRGGVPA